MFIAADGETAFRRHIDRLGDAPEEETRFLGLVLEVRVFFALRDFEQRRLRDVEMAAVDDLAHVAVEERQDQRADVRAVDVCVRHDDDLVVAELRDAEVVRTNARAEGGDHQADLLG
jgi:hypothetical protein